MRARVDGRAVDVPSWVMFAARFVSSDAHEGYTETEVWGECSRCETRRAVALANAPQPLAEAALGAFALHHRGCESVVERAERAADAREKKNTKAERRLKQVPAAFAVGIHTWPANDTRRR